MPGACGLNLLVAHRVDVARAEVQPVRLFVERLVDHGVLKRHTQVVTTSAATLFFVRHGDLRHSAKPVPLGL